MMMMHGSAPTSRYATPQDTETISISIGLGSDGRSSSIVLPRGHDLPQQVQPQSPAPLQPLLYAREPESSRFDAVRALSSLSYQTSPEPSTSSQMPPMASMSQYTHANSRYEMSASMNSSSRSHIASAPHSPLYHSDSSSNGGVRVYHHSQEYVQSEGEYRATRTRRRRGANGSSGSSKRCQVLHCDKISVSRGLCRGHGGGRRCQHESCSKGAQSRSNFCWAHGGGQRCEVKNCMRSRKSKRFCVAHLNWECSAPMSPTATVDSAECGRVVYDTMPPLQMAKLPKTIMPKAVCSVMHEGVTGASPTTLSGSPRLPSLLQALRNTQQSSMVAQN
ncbi:hypothetical protein G195_011645 [Phytophthora kernoviae 00238/432]|uniref:WRKY19-like zinc finger domain-containing protein n=1 Tax=Phytophthora kernoviae 00238/432 TaxID=1284355 RepID=A0A8J4S4E4_9STRA|nr:hypothetical protein G195_011645 [Phytophthora kernoviae 00238/432]